MRKQAYLILLFCLIAFILFSCKQARNDVSVIPMDAALYVKSKPAPERPEPVKAPEPDKEAEAAQKEETAGSQADASDFFNLGMTLENAGRYDEAVKAYKQAVLIRPDYAEAYYHLGLSLDDAGRFDEAIEAYRRVQSISPDHVEAAYNLGVALEKTGNYTEAAKAYQQVTRLKDDHADAHYHLGYSFLMLDDTASALDEYKILQKLVPRMAGKLAESAVKKAEADRNNKYILQLAAFKNINNANDLLKKLKPHYMHAYIERENNFSKVRITGIKSRDELDLMKEDVIRKFKANPYTIELQ